MSDRTAIIPFPQTPDAVLTEHIGTGMECVVVAGVDSDGNITSVASTGVTILETIGILQVCIARLTAHIEKGT